MKNFPPFYLGMLMVLLIGLIVQIPFEAFLDKDYFSAFQLEYIPLTLKMFLILIVGAVGIRIFRLKTLAGLSSTYKWTNKLFNLIPVYLFLLGIASFPGKDLTAIDPWNLMLLLIACLMVGFAEEFMFRGFLQPLFLKKYISAKKGIFLGILFPSAFFGASHLLNLTVNDNIPQVIVQAIYALLIGFFFGVLLLSTNKLVPIAITHGLINFFFLFASLPGIANAESVSAEPQTQISFVAQVMGYLMPFFLVLPLFIVGLFMVRKIKKEQVLEKMEL